MVPNSPSLSFAGLLLAGGRSQRMGRDKAQLNWRGRPLGDHQAATLAATGASPLYVSCRADQPWTPPGFTRLEDRASEGDALAAFVEALLALDADVTVVLAIDLPLVQSAWLMALATAALDQQASAVPFHAGHFEPLAAAWHRSARPVLQSALAQNGSLQRACAALQEKKLLHPVTLTTEHAAQLANLNTPADAARLGCTA